MLRIFGWATNPCLWLVKPKFHIQEACMRGDWPTLWVLPPHSMANVPCASTPDGPTHQLLFQLFVVPFPKVMGQPELGFRLAQPRLCTLFVLVFKRLNCLHCLLSGLALIDATGSRSPKSDCFTKTPDGESLVHHLDPKATSDYGPAIAYVGEGRNASFPRTPCPACHDSGTHSGESFRLVPVSLLFLHACLILFASCPNDWHPTIYHGGE